MSNNWPRIFKDFIDGFGLLAQSPPKRDGGDTHNREGLAYFGYFLLGDTLDHRGMNPIYGLWLTCEVLQDHGDKLSYTRHPDPKKWYGRKPYLNLSRDQEIPMVAALGLGSDNYDLRKHLDYKFHGWLKRFTFMYNWKVNGQYPTKEEHDAKSTKDWDGYKSKLPDIGIAMLPVWIRAYRYRLAYCLLWVMDFEMVLSSINKVWLWRWNHGVHKGDDLQFIVRLIQAKHVYETPFSKLATWIYKKRPHQSRVAVKPYRKKGQRWADCEYKYETKSGPQSALQYYFRTDTDGSSDPPIDRIYKPLVEAL